MATSDKPKVNFSTAALRREAATKVDPYVYMTSSNKRVAFPDPYEMDADAGEDKLWRWQSGAVKPGQVIDEWLSEADAKALADEKFTVRERATLLQHAIQYYEQHAGSLGEGDDSES